MTLQTNSTLQGGKYRILSVLGHGEVSIAYFAEQGLPGVKVIIKEFFLKGLCEREEGSSLVTLGTSCNREMVERCRQKFLKEARTIFKLNHPNIVHILDVFEENDTAYYVMEYIQGESLADVLKRRGALPEAEALGYIAEVGNALKYIHNRKINHLDIKPSNIMRREEDGRIMLIDFGVSKQYDLVTPEGPLNTSVGISLGYSPAEQYRQHGVQTFSPQSDVYSLAATLYKLLTGITPREAIEIQDEGLSIAELEAKCVSALVIGAIQRAMLGRHERTQTIAAFLSDLGCAGEEDSEETEIVEDVSPKSDSNRVAPTDQESHDESEESKLKPSFKIMFGVATLFMICLFLGICYKINVSDRAKKQKTVSSTQFSNRWRTFKVNGISFVMVRVEGGTFTMGAEEQASDAEKVEKPAHQVTLSTYSIGETEVTQELWEAVMGNNPSHFKGAKRPVENVSWFDCQKFIRKLNEASGKTFRLPTEAEWEYAARGGNRSQGYEYSGNNRIEEVAWHEYISGKETHEVAMKQSNELGLFDMSGNVWEWCQDWFGEYDSSSQTNPKGPENGSFRVYRGGCWLSPDYECRLSCRNFSIPGEHNLKLGFRLALTE